ncbi:MAG: hypothetical protein KAI79_12170 [Bacteroidales bacterium]|nr:hypothetical protein [Bacteroidales bacterium]
MITIDDYYSTEFYNESKESLKNNNIEFQEFISIKPPFSWYLDLPQKPIMVNYDEISNTEKRWLVTKVKPLRPNESYLLVRRNDDVGQKAILKYTENQPLKEARTSDYAVFFDATNKDQLLQITKDIPVKIYYFGKHYSNKYRVALCTNKMILNYIDPQQIMLEKKGGEFKEPGRFEAELNFKIFRGNDYLVKYTETMYFEDGKFKDVKIRDKRLMNI